MAAYLAIYIYILLLLCISAASEAAYFSLSHLNARKKCSYGQLWARTFFDRVFLVCRRLFL